VSEELTYTITFTASELHAMSWACERYLDEKNAVRTAWLKLLRPQAETLIPDPRVGEGLDLAKEMGW
jgi:hypothetical protein